MRLVDFYIDPILKINQAKADIQFLEENWESFKADLISSLLDAQVSAVNRAFLRKHVLMLCFLLLLILMSVF